MARKKRVWLGLAVSLACLWLVFRSLDPGALVAALAQANFLYVLPALAVLFCEPRTGQLVQRVNLVVAAPRLDLQCRYHPVPAVVPRVRYQSLALEQSEPAVQFCHEGMIIEWGGNTWGLNSAFALFNRDP